MMLMQMFAIFSDFFLPVWCENLQGSARYWELGWHFSGCVTSQDIVFYEHACATLNNRVMIVGRGYSCWVFPPLFQDTLLTIMYPSYTPNFQ